MQKTHSFPKTGKSFLKKHFVNKILQLHIKIISPSPYIQWGSVTSVTVNPHRFQRWRHRGLLPVVRLAAPVAADSRKWLAAARDDGVSGRGEKVADALFVTSAAADVVVDEHVRCAVVRHALTLWWRESVHATPGLQEGERGVIHNVLFTIESSYVYALIRVQEEFRHMNVKYKLYTHFK